MALLDRVQSPVPLDVEYPTKCSIDKPHVDVLEPQAPPSYYEADTIGTALHVINTERDALANLSYIYRTDDLARRNLAEAIHLISGLPAKGGRLIVTGMGKSGKIAEKCVATMNSLSIRSAFLHPSEALHGDMGMVGPNDALLVLSYSARTPELSAMMPHLPPIPRILISGQTDPNCCPLLKQDSHLWTLLPAPIPVTEVQSFGVSAPTTSTTVALALTDALALAVGRTLHTDPQAAFKRNHPGGVIGQSR